MPAAWLDGSRDNQVGDEAQNQSQKDSQMGKEIEEIRAYCMLITGTPSRQGQNGITFYTVGLLQSSSIVDLLVCVQSPCSKEPVSPFYSPPLARG